MANRPERLRFRPAAVMLFLLVMAPVRSTGPAASAASDLRRTPIVVAVEKARSAVVNIQGRKTVRTDQGEDGGMEAFRQVNGMGTGIIIDPRGYILTNYHVVESVETIHVTTADRQPFVARLVAHDPLTDLAVIRIDAAKPLTTIELGVSSDLMPGEPVLAIGNAFGYEHTVTRGIISALHRDVQVSATQKYNDLIQTDASINPGNSGGPLLNIDGEMIGINVAVRVGAQGIGFAMPVDEAMEIAARLLSAERIGGIKHGIVGETKKSGTDRYVHVLRVTPGSAAAEAGVRVGDVLSKIEDLPLKRLLDFERAVVGHRPGERLALTVIRDQQPVSLELPLAARAGAVADAFDDRTWQTLGMRLSPAAMDDTRRVPSPYRGGMRVVAVRPDGPAASQGIRSGDILVGLHVWETVSQDNLLYVLNHADFEKFQPIKFYILRGKETLYGHLTAQRSAVLQASRRTSTAAN